MKVYSRDAHPIAKATVTLVHDTNQAMSGLWRIKTMLEEGKDHKEILKTLKVVEARLQVPLNSFYKFIGDHPEIPA